MDEVGLQPEHKDDHDVAAQLIRCQAELLETQEALLIAQQQLRRLSGFDAALIGQITSGLRHDLGNALTVIRLNMSLMGVYRFDDAKFTRHLNSVQDGVRGVERILTATRYFPVPERGNRELVDLGLILQELIELEPSPASMITLQLPEAQALIRGVTTHLQRAFAAILDNALEAVHGIEIPAIKITLDIQDEAFSILFEDNGSGLTEEVLRHAGEPGFTTHLNDSIHLGMGLFVANTIFVRHNGQLKISNLADGGAVVEISLPRA